METQKYYFRVGAFCLAIVAIFVYYLIYFSGGAETKNLTRYAIYFNNSISGLSRGAPVKLKGIAVGVVERISFVSRDNDRILVLADIAESAPIRQDTVASIEFQGITGATFLSLENTRPDEPPVYLKKEPGEKYPVIMSAKSELQTVLSSAPQLMGQMQKLMSDKNIVSVQVLLSEMHEVTAEATGALREIKMLARTVREDPSIILRGSSHDGYKVQK